LFDKHRTLDLHVPHRLDRHARRLQGDVAAQASAAPACRLLCRRSPGPDGGRQQTCRDDAQLYQLSGRSGLAASLINRAEPAGIPRC
jgi:hypothetical protein